jgi:phosphoribosyl 1,2-cyclic phosphodiesterase
MLARVWGCRGSIAAPGPATVRYGGNTSCVELRLPDGSVAILDAGTGIRTLGAQLVADDVRVIHVMLSHLHLDHLQGLAFFAPLYRSDVELHLWGPPSPIRTLADRVAAYMSDPLFPVNLADVPCHLIPHDAPMDGVEIGGATVWAAPVTHQGPTVGYRVEEGDATFAYIPDHEPALGGIELTTAERAWILGIELADGADVLLHDAQYTSEEYVDHVGWGHSAIEHVVQFALTADVEQLVLFHHDPAHADDDLESIHTRAMALWGDRPNPPLVAHEGMEIPVGSVDLRDAPAATTASP